MAAGRGWDWPSSKIRQTQLTEWLVSQVADKDPVACWDISIEAFYADQLPGQPEDAVYEIALGDLKELKRTSLIELQQNTGGLRALHVQVTLQARDHVEALRDIRASRRARQSACRDALVDWLYARDAVTDMPPFPPLKFMLDDRAHGIWYAEPFTAADLDQASAWLERHQLIAGPHFDQCYGPVQAYLTDAGAECAADFGSDTERYVAAQRAAPHGGPVVNIGSNHGAFQVSGDNSHQVQHIGANADDIRLMISGVTEIVRQFAPGARDARQQEEAALAAVTSGSVDLPALERFRDWAVTAVKAGASNAVVAAVSSSVTFVLMQAGHMALHL